MSPRRLPSAAARKLLLKNLPPDQRRELRRKVSGIKAFADGFVGIHLWPYQLEAADAIVKSVLARDGESFVLIFARQSGKDELLANLILYLMARLAEQGASIVCAQPTFQPQTINAMDRLQARTAQRPFFRLAGFHCSHGYIFRAPRRPRHLPLRRSLRQRRRRHRRPSPDHQ